MARKLCRGRARTCAGKTAANSCAHWNGRALWPQARAYITHINQENEWDTAQYQAYMDKNAPISVTIARDGMEIG